MAESRARCTQCNAEMTLQPIDPVCGEHGVLKIVFIQLPALVCANAHRHFAVPDFPTLLLDRVAGEGLAKLPAAEKRGLFFKRYHCSACGAKLGGGETREEDFDSDITLEGLPPLRVELTAPLHRCASCGKEQVRSLERIRKLVPSAVTRALKVADLRPN